MPARKPARSSTSAKKSAKPAKAARKAPATSGKTVQPAAARLQYRNVTPMLVIDGASDAIAWYAKAFGAQELSRNALPTGRLMHAAIQIGDSVLMMADSFGPAPQKMAGVTLHIQSPSIQKYWDAAVAGGAQVEMPLANQFWGDRYGQLRDPFGHAWSLGWPAKMTEAEKQRLQAEAMKMFAAGGHP